MKKLIQNLKMLDKPSILTILLLFVIVILFTFAMEACTSSKVSSEEYKQELGICDVTSDNYQMYLTWYQSSNPTYKLFDTEEDAKEYGIAAKLNGYNYEIGETVYNMSDCIIELYRIEISILENTCYDENGLGNETIIIPTDIQEDWSSSNINISASDYLISQGYFCENDDYEK